MEIIISVLCALMSANTGNKHNKIWSDLIAKVMRLNISLVVHHIFFLLTKNMIKLLFPLQVKL